MWIWWSIYALPWFSPAWFSISVLSLTGQCNDGYFWQNYSFSFLWSEARWHFWAHGLVHMETFFFFCLKFIQGHYFHWTWAVCTIAIHTSIEVSFAIRAWGRGDSFTSSIGGQKGSFMVLTWGYTCWSSFLCSTCKRDGMDLILHGPPMQCPRKARAPVWAQLCSTQKKAKTAGSIRCVDQCPGLLYSLSLLSNAASYTHHHLSHGGV